MQGHWSRRMDHDPVLRRVACVYIRETDPSERKKLTAGKQRVVCGGGRLEETVGMQARAAPRSQEGSRLLAELVPSVGCISGCQVHRGLRQPL